MADLSPRRTRIANALPHLAQALHRFERALRGGSDRHAAIGVGIHAEAVIDQGDQVDTALDVKDATGMHVLARNLARLIRLFPEWNAFVEAAAPLTAEARAEIRRAMILLIGELDGRDTVDPAVIARLRDLLGAIDDPTASATAWKAAVAGVRTVFIRLAGWLLALGADDRSEVSKKAVAGAAIGTIGTVSRSLGPSSRTRRPISTACRPICPQASTECATCCRMSTGTESRTKHDRRLDP